MTDWQRVEKLRAKGVSWDEIAEDERVDFKPEKGTDPGRAVLSKGCPTSFRCPMGIERKKE